MFETRAMNRARTLRHAGLFFLFLEVAVGIVLIVMAVINYDIFFRSLVDIERFQLLLFLGVFVPAALAITFGILTSIFAQRAWGDERCKTLIGNTKIPKTFVIIIDALLYLFLLTGLWDLTTSFLYLYDGGGIHDFIPGLVLGPIVLYWKVWWLILLGGVKVLAGIALTIYEARHWIGKDKICEVLFKPE